MLIPGSQPRVFSLRFSSIGWPGTPGTPPPGTPGTPGGNVSVSLEVMLALRRLQDENESLQQENTRLRAMVRPAAALPPEEAAASDVPMPSRDAEGGAEIGEAREAGSVSMRDLPRGDVTMSC